ncbi:threonine aldolase family protein [Chryseolinea lacunae]|uniref:Low specificity L-threonine aldolase n=1 Tax=Chryseolinea lacunae TaxID=2801331 RepID=A0ABS1L158_9BACT|nr:low specificity L-threonine aldolase [Chryseolinea lacunae]MBL0745384.1 low specificity L-threonine aldolase [Chryseolinea lacunae]
MKHTFASDNYSGVHPDIMEALINANRGHQGSYGADVFTEEAVAKFRALLGNDIEVFFAYNGTGANVMGLSAMTRSFDSIICSDLAHINVDESTAPEKFMGCKLVTIPTTDGKIYPSQVEEKIQRIDDQHHPQARVISISQTTEYATVYSIEEVKALSAVARKHNLFLHMDGSRISNAAASLQADFRAFTRDAGVDVLSFGGTKNGMMFGEAVIFFRPELATTFKYIRKQSMQLHSKMRFISAQFSALLSNELWKKNASHANAMAKLLEAEIRKTSAIITQRVDANGIFMIVPTEVIPKLQEEHFFYVWNDKLSEARLMCSFDTTEEEIRNFGKKLKELLA